MFSVIPAIDILGGRVVRLRQGVADRETVYGTDPVDTARRWLDEGAHRIHLVSLDGALGRDGLPLRVVSDVARLGLQVQVGGGVRTADAARRMRDAGAARVVVGSLLAQPDELQRVVDMLGPEALTVSLDVRDGWLLLKGWLASAPLTFDDADRLLRRLHLSTVIVTGVARDGTETGPDLALTREWVRRGFLVTAAGGIGRIRDLEDLKETGAVGAIVGRALYEARFGFREARAAVC